jgi:hypothetical protein
MANKKNAWCNQASAMAGSKEEPNPPGIIIKSRAWYLPNNFKLTQQLEPDLLTTDQQT